jgi:voltage-gated potassium channel Kch
VRRFTLRERLRYAFDNTLSRGPIGLVAWLALLSAAIILGVSGLLYLAASPADRAGFDDSYLRLAWNSLLHTLGTGSLGDQGSLPYLAAMLAITLAGIFLLSSLIGLITSAIDERLQRLRKGRSMVVETDHTVILGWSEHVFTFIAELVEANVSRRRRCIAILAPRDKVEMEDEIEAAVDDLRGSRVVCRTGSPMEPADLAIVNLAEARAILILAGTSADPDAEVIKTLLAIASRADGSARSLHIVAEVRDPANADAARLASRGQASVVLAGELISRIIAQTARQSGLSLVYSELLAFAGDEIYFHAEPSLAGRRFGETLAACGDSSVVGLARDGRTKLLPPLDTLLTDQDQLIVIARDEGVTRLGEPPAEAVDASALVGAPPAAPAARHTLVLGWNWRGPEVLAKMDRYLAPGSTATVVARSDRPAAELAGAAAGLRHLTVTSQVADTTDRRALGALELHRFHHVLVLCYSDELPPDVADARTLVTLLHLRDLLGRTDPRPSVVSEMLDVRNRRLAEITRADDFIVSDQLVSLLMAQIAENRALDAVFADLFAVEGAELYLKAAVDYVRPDRPVSFYTVLEAARRRGEIAIGYRRLRQAADPEAGYGIVLNPPKATPVRFEAGDQVIVLAEA